MLFLVPTSKGYGRTISMPCQDFQLAMSRLSACYVKIVMPGLSELGDRHVRIVTCACQNYHLRMSELSPRRVSFVTWGCQDCQLAMSGLAPCHVSQDLELFMLTCQS